MRTLEYTFWRDEMFFIGYLNKHSDYRTQAYSLEELIKHLTSLLVDLKALGIA